MPSTFTLADLHGLLQAAMGWKDEHLHQFRIDGVSYTTIHPAEPDEAHDERSFRVSGVAEKGRSFTYEYDLADGWLHELTVEDVHDGPADSAVLCLAGEGACPPEGCGGPSAYAGLLSILADPHHHDREDVKAWLGDFDPAAFDLERVNDALRVACPRRSAP